MSDDASTVLTSTQVDDRAPRGWREVDGMLRTRLRTAGYTEAVELVTRIAATADEADHHPDVVLTYPTVTVSLSSHDVGGITSRDVDLADRRQRRLRLVGVLGEAADRLPGQRVGAVAL